MTLSADFKLERLARMIADGYPATVAAKRAGRGDLSRTFAEQPFKRRERLGAHRASAESRSVTAARKRPAAAEPPVPEAVEPPRPRAKHTLSDADWLAKYAPRPPAGTGAAA